MQRVRMKKVVNIDSLSFPSPVLTRDALNRITETRFTYKSIVVYYTVDWDGETNFINTYTQTIEDRV